MRALAAMPEEKVDTSDIPELPPGAWKNAVRGKWYRPVKQAVSIRLDAVDRDFEAMTLLAQHHHRPGRIA
jgi:hypothetical protein